MTTTVTTVVTTTVPTTTVTTVPTTTVTTVPTTTVTTVPTTTTPVPTHQITVTYTSNKGSVTTSPPEPAAAVSDGGVITVSDGASQTFYFTANSNKAVQSITDNGLTVYTGPSAQGATITYIVSNVIADHTLVGTFV